MAIKCVILLPASLGLISILLGLVSGLWCRLVFLPPNDAESSQDLQSYQLGVYFRRDQGAAFTFDSCVPYSFEIWANADGYWRAAMVVLPMSWVVAFLLLFCLTISAWCPYPPNAYKIVGYTYVLVCIPCQALSFLILSSNLCAANNPQLVHQQQQPGSEADGDNGGSLLQLYEDSCELGTGGYLGIAAAVGYLLTGLCCCFLGPKCLAPSTSGTSKPYQVPPSSSGPPSTTQAMPPPRQSQQPPPSQVGSVVTFDEEKGGYPPAAVAATAAAGVGVAGAGAAAAYNRHYASSSSAKSYPPPLQRQNPPPPQNMRMTYEERRELYSAVGHGAVIGAHAGPDTVRDVPSVVVKQPEEGLLMSSGERRALVMAAAAGAAVGARARADTAPDEYNQDEFRSAPANDIPDEIETQASVPVDLDEQDFLNKTSAAVLVAETNEEQLPPGDGMVRDDSDHEDPPASRANNKPDPPASWDHEDLSPALTTTTTLPLLLANEAEESSAYEAEDEAEDKDDDDDGSSSSIPDPSEANEIDDIKDGQRPDANQSDYGSDEGEADDSQQHAAGADASDPEDLDAGIETAARPVDHQEPSPADGESATASRDGEIDENDDEPPIAVATESFRGAEEAEPETIGPLGDQHHGSSSHDRHSRQDKMDAAFSGTDDDSDVFM